MRIYLIRHGQSAGNVNYFKPDEKSCSADPELTDKGHQQAKLLGEHLSHPQGEPVRYPWLEPEERVPVGYGITHVYCSLMIRSILTAQYIAEACRLPLVAHLELFEMEGMYDYDDDGNRIGEPGPGKDYFTEIFPNLQLPKNMNPDGWYDRPFETDEMFLERTKAIMPEFEERHGGTDDCIAIVIHGDLIDQLINELTGATRHSDNYDNHWVANWAFHNTSVTRIDYVNESRAVVYTNQFQHLPPELLTW